MVRYCCFVIFWRLAFKSRQNWVSAFMYFSLSAAKQLFHHVILRVILKFYRTILTDDCENLIPAHIGLLQICLTHGNVGGGNRCIRCRVLCNITCTGYYFFAVYPTGNAHCILFDKLTANQFLAIAILQPTVGFRKYFFGT